LFASKFRTTAEENGEKTGAVKCMIFDDTILTKTGRCIEKNQRYESIGVLLTGIKKTS